MSSPEEEERDGGKSRQPSSSSSLFFVRVDLEENINTSDDDEDEEDKFPFTTGNKVKRLEGSLRLFREEDQEEDDQGMQNSRSRNSSSSESKLVLVPFIPSSFSVADFLEFVAPGEMKMKEVRVVVPRERKREESDKAKNTNNKSSSYYYFAAILLFDDCENARMFTNNFHGQPFSSLSSEEICRCVFVKSVKSGRKMMMMMMIMRRASRASLNFRRRVQSVSIGWTGTFPGY